jgi:hypothetical protein
VPKIDAGAVIFADVARQLLDVVDAGIHRPHCANGKAAIAAALLARGALDHHDGGTLLARRQRCRQAREPAADHQHIGIFHPLSLAILPTMTECPRRQHHS